MQSETIKQDPEKTLQISKSSESYLKEMSGWTYFFSILGAIFIGLLVIGSVSLAIIFSTVNNENMPAFSGVAIGLIYLILSLVYFFPVYYLFKFSSNMKKAMESKDNNNLELAFSSIKSHFKYMGFLTIILIAIYIIIAIMMLFTGMVTNFWQ